MDERTALQLQILRRLGAPLAGAAASAAQPALAVAQLLGLAGENGAALAQAVGGGDAAVRVALTALVGELLADQARGGTLPDAAVGRRLAEALNAALNGGQALVADAQRLDTLHEGLPRDPMQLALQQAAALTPVIAAIATQSFGADPAALSAGIAERLTGRATQGVSALAPALAGPEAKVAALEILRGFAPLYAACHAAEAARGGNADAAWTAFERQAALLETLALNALPADLRAAATARAPAASAPAAPPPPVEDAPAATTPPSGNPANPMSFFKPTAKKAATSGDAAEGTAEG